MMKSILAIAVALTAVMTLATLPTIVGIKTQAQVATQLPTIPANSDHLPVHTVQDDKAIVTTVTKSGNAPEGPVIVIPPGPAGGENGTIITPGENSTVENPGNITIITPGGNVTEIPGNVTEINNGTGIIIVPPEQNITEVPISPSENITVIGPHPEHPIVLPNETNAGQGQPCTCSNQTTTIPPVLITPAPGQNVTTNPPVTEQPGGAHGNETFPANNATQSNPPTGTGTNQTGNTGSNETQTTPANNNTNTNTEPPHATQLPASATVTSPFLPGYNIHNISYKPVNQDFLNK